MEISLLGKNNTAWDNTVDPSNPSLMKVENVPFVDPGTFSPVTRLNCVYTGSWAATGAFSSFTSQDGFQLEFPFETQEIDPDGYGVVDILFKKIEAMCKVKPFAATSTPISENEAINYLGWQGAGNYRGESLNTLSSTHDLTITGNAAAGQTVHQHLVVNLSMAALIGSKMQFGNGTLRNGEFGFIATRTFSGTGMNTLASLTLS